MFYHIHMLYIYIHSISITFYPSYPMSHLSCPITLSISSGPGEISSCQGVSAALFATVALHPDRGRRWGWKIHPPLGVKVPRVLVKFPWLGGKKGLASCWVFTRTFLLQKSFRFLCCILMLVESLYFALFPSLLLLVICPKVWWVVWSIFVLLTSSLYLLAGYSCWLIASNMF